MKMQMRFLLLVWVVLTGCKLQRENTAQDQQLGRIGGKISKELSSRIDAAVKKFAKDGDTTDISAIIKGGGRAADEAIATFTLLLTRKQTKVSASLQSIAQQAENLQRTSKIKNIDYDKLLRPFFDDANAALDDMLATASKYYRALPQLADNEELMRKLYKEQAAMWLKIDLPKLADFSSTAGLAEKTRQIQALAHDAYGAALRKIHNLPAENYFLAGWWTKMSPAVKITDNKHAVKVFDDIMAGNAQEANRLYLSFTQDNVKRIEEIIYQKMPISTTVNKVDYHLDELIHELNALKLNVSARKKTLAKVFSANNVDTLRKTHEQYLLQISETGRRIGRQNPEVLRGRVFGVWGDDIYAQVAAWEKQHGKVLDSVEDVEVRDMLYDLQEMCRKSNC